VCVSLSLFCGGGALERQREREAWGIKKKKLMDQSVDQVHGNRQKKLKIILR
jgi:hypothetical protein